ncbi:hypothetical protein K1F50_06505 [Muricauda oceani]|uniref:Uncharacterized protein n=1 Tax=Flagellimonas oceani TaxID=2698672 RepID=A0A6G7J6F6_9FLAO|nr:hypothetical protein [Allomuricauda oceani]MBW8242447.1 hypothetical protein [Allomuricauda oceani]QII46209.1 hypothetical protein GVT53_16490 [Allomuricauda oceani]
MSKTDFFRIIIKMFGLYCFIEALFQFTPNLSVSWGFDSARLVISLISLLSTLIVAYLLLFQTNRLIKFLRLGKGYDSEHIETKDLNKKGLFNLGLIMIGLLMIVDNIAQFLNFCYLAFKKQVSSNGLDEIEGAMLYQQLDYNWWIISGLNVLFGIIILINYKQISKLLIGKEKE